MAEGDRDSEHLGDSSGESPLEQRGGAAARAEQDGRRGRGQESGGQLPGDRQPDPRREDEPGPRRGGPGWLRGRVGLTLAVVWTVCGVLLAAAAAVYLLKQVGLFDGKAGLKPWASRLLVFRDNALWANFIIFAVAAVVVWMGGTKLSTYADLIADRTGMGRAFVGMLLLATATSLPEVATTATAALPPVSNAPLLVSNLLGGIAMQTAILAGVDLLLVRRGALSYFSPKPVLMIQGVMLVALLAVAILGGAVGSPAWLYVLGVGPWGAALLLMFLAMLWMTHSESQHPRWAPSNPPREVDGSDLKRAEERRFRGTSNRRLYLSFAAGALVILAGGFVLARVADAIAGQTGLGSTLVGAILLAISTSLPEVSTTARAARLGAYSMAFSNIFGSNAFCVALLFLGDVLYRGGPILDAASRQGLFLGGLGILVTCAYLWGLLERKDKTIFGMGIDSAIVLVLYLGGMAVLYMMS